MLGWVAAENFAAADLAKRYPAIKVEPNMLYVDNGQIVTSGAGVATSIDMRIRRLPVGKRKSARV
jgi:transcriptional regulator GlxA family with amidase domain